MDLPTVQGTSWGPQDCLHSPQTFINFIAESCVLLHGEMVAWMDKEARIIKHLSSIQKGEHGGAQSLSPEDHHLHCLVRQRVLVLKITLLI